MTPDELRAIMQWLREQVHLAEPSADGEPVVRFDPPSADEAEAAGLNRAGYQQLRDAPWWDEMADDIIETPEMCDGDDPPEQVL